MSLDNNKLIVDTTDEEEYTEIVNSLKIEFRKKLEDKLIKANEQMKTRFLKVLGSDFSLLIEQRGELLKIFRIAESELLKFAVDYCNGKDEFNQLAEWVNSKDNPKDKIKKAKQLFKIISDKVEAVNPALVEKNNEIHKEVEKNSNEIRAIIDSSRPYLEDIEKDFRDDLQKDIVEFIVQYNNQLKEVDRAFGKSEVGDSDIIKSPFEGDYKIPPVEISIFDDSDDDLVIPLKSDNHELN